ncbi:hypothetical protein JY651_12410 [Pyxidicoccus parkwayensis]|uniref:Uncharacterized protein n=1 Tax=Pyxidicoccus parkwayensis TaxID=2813578 RepID=A0ABX7P5D3_9BACT|nr:hypothetical protein [Pyxidicoccus parkwaysis]QSQ25678.1 hypothetical protein JY651_12410 [Pyxidicoccus parkwaysis]
MPPIQIQYVDTPAQPGPLQDGVVQPCPITGVIAVTLQYPQDQPAHDVTVELVPLYVSRRVEGNTTYFEVMVSGRYTVRLQSAGTLWAAQLGHVYRAEGRADHHAAVTIPLRRAPALTVTCRDHHFAPGVEQLDAFYTATNLAADTLKVTIRGTQYGGDVVYEVNNVLNADGDHPLDNGNPWGGIANSGVLNNLAINPLHSPYTIRVSAENTGVFAEAQFHVLYHSVSLALGTYTADGAAPDVNTDPIAWTQFKLNALGYFAGPVTNALNDQTRRAMKRYAFQHPALSERIARNQGDAYVNNGPFRTALGNNAEPRTIIQNNALPAADAAARIYVDHNYFYYNLPDFSADDGHATLDEQTLDRFEVPLEATILLMGRNDADGTGVGVAAPRAVGDVSIEWWVEEPAEDTAGLPDGTDPNIPSRTRAYVNAALVATRDGAGNANCPATHGGARQAVNRNAGYFRTGNVLPPFATAAAGEVVSTPAYQGGDGKRGRAGVLFQGSYIAGDKYRIQAKLSFQGRPHRDALQNAHCQVRGGAQWDAILRARTGQMTLWRQHRIAAVVEWPQPAQAINWGEVAAEYARAYCELDHGQAITLTAAQMRARHFENDPLAPTFEQTMRLVVGASLRSDFQVGNVTWSNDSLFDTNIDVPVQGGEEKARVYSQRVKADTRAALSMNFLQSYAEGVATFVAGRGGIIIHGRWVPALRVTHRPTAPWKDPHDEDLELGLMCIGLTRGVVVLSHAMYPDYQSRFIVAHEMGHSRFLNHHETGSAPQANGTNPHSDTPTHHDLRDHNCMMCYPWGIPSRNPRIGRSVDWGRVSADRPAFCGKCNLKLRGWKVTTAAVPNAS